MTVGDYDLRGLDFETYLCGPVTDKIIDADRLVRADGGNGYPNWAMYRTVYAGDSHLRRRVRDWCVAYAVAAAESGVIRTGLPVDEMGCLAGWDAFYRLHDSAWIIGGQDIADIAGVDPKTYRKLRNYVYASLRLSLQDYFVAMQISIRQVWKMDRFAGAEIRNAWRESPDGTEVDGNGNFRTLPANIDP